MKAIEKEYLLDRAGVDAISRDFYEWMREAGAERRDAFQIRMTVEDMLLKISNHYPDAVTVSMSLRKRFGAPTVRFRYEGEAFNPSDAVEDELDELADRILAGLGLTPTWRYVKTTNELTLRVPTSGSRTDWKLLGALMAAVVMGLLGGLLPDAFKQPVSAYVLGPLTDAFMRLMNTFAGLMVFFSILTGICGIGNASDFGKIGKTMLTRFLGLTFLATGICIVAATPFFDLAAGSISENSSLGMELINIIMDILPSDPISPFAEGNMLQIIFLDILIGVAVLRIGGRSQQFREGVSDCNMVLMETVRMICRLLPIYIFVSLTQQLWENGIPILLRLWKPIVFSICFFSLAIIVKILYVCRKFRIRPLALLQALLPAMIIGFATASSATTYSECMDNCDHKLGIAPEFSHTAIPMGILYGTVTSTLFVMIALYVAEIYQIPVNVIWFITAFLLCAILDIACPPVAGGTLICAKIMLVQLGAPASALSIAVTLAIILDFFGTGTRTALLQMEVLLQAEKLGLLDKDIMYANFERR